MFKRILMFFVATAMMMAMAGCGGGSTPAQANKVGSIAAAAQTVPSDVVTLRVAISAPGRVTIQHDFAGTDGKIDSVPIGTNLTVTISGLDASGNVLYQGTVNNITVSDGITTDVGAVALQPVTVPTYTISGSVKTASGTGVPGVEITLTGASTMTTSTDISGNYSFTGLSNGSYIVAGSVSTYTLSAAVTVPVNSANVTDINFTATPIPDPSNIYSISGMATAQNYNSSLIVSLSGPVSRTTTTYSHGFFLFGGLPNGTYTITSSLRDYTFNTQTVTISNGDVSSVGIRGVYTPATYSISGQVTYAYSVAAGSAVYMQISPVSGYYPSASVSVGSETLPSSIETAGFLGGQWYVVSFKPSSTLAANTPISYKISGLPYGRYQVGASQPSTTTPFASAASVTVDVNGADVTDQNITVTTRQ